MLNLTLGEAFTFPIKLQVITDTDRIYGKNLTIFINPPEMGLELNSTIADLDEKLNKLKAKIKDL